MTNVLVFGNRMYRLILHDLRARSSSSDIAVAIFDARVGLPKTYKLQSVSRDGQILLKQDHNYRVALKVMVAVSRITIQF